MDRSLFNMKPGSCATFFCLEILCSFCLDLKQKDFIFLTDKKICSCFHRLSTQSAFNQQKSYRSTSQLSIVAAASSEICVCQCF